MKLATYAVRGEVSYGAVVGQGIVDLRSRLGASRFPTLKSVLAAGALEEARRAAEGQSADHQLGAVTLKPEFSRLAANASKFRFGSGMYGRETPVGYQKSTLHGT